MKILTELTGLILTTKLAKGAKERKVESKKYLCRGARSEKDGSKKLDGEEKKF